MPNQWHNGQLVNLANSAQLASQLAARHWVIAPEAASSGTRVNFQRGSTEASLEATLATTPGVSDE